MLTHTRGHKNRKDFLEKITRLWFCKWQNTQTRGLVQNCKYVLKVLFGASGNTSCKVILDFEIRRGEMALIHRIPFYLSSREEARLVTAPSCMDVSRTGSLVFTDIWLLIEAAGWVLGCTGYTLRSNSVKYCKSSKHIMMQNCRSRQDIFRAFFSGPRNSHFPLTEDKPKSKRPSIKHQQERLLGETFTGKRLHLMTS